jgi:hypothetical protein
MEMSAAKPKRRWLRFSLRTLLVLVTIVGVWIGSQMSAARRQKQAVEALQSAGAEIYYDYQRKVGPPPITLPPPSIPGTKPPSHYFDPRATVAAPEWLRVRLGDDYFKNVIDVQFNRQNSSFEPSVLRMLSNLPRLRCFWILEGKNVRDADLGAFAHLSDLEVLHISNAPIKGSFLASLRNPERVIALGFTDTEFDDNAMSYFAAMPNLEKLFLSNTRITDSGLRHLKVSPTSRF